MSLKCIEMQDLHAIFFNKNIVLIIFIVLVCRLWKKCQKEVQIISFGHNMKKILLIKVGF
jgi:hypothetical protein